MALYNLKSSDGDYTITKFDNELNVESSYTVSLNECTCPAGSRPSCRHRQMLPKMLDVDACDQPLFYDFENDKFYEQQVADQSEPETEIRDTSPGPLIDSEASCALEPQEWEIAGTVQSSPTEARSALSTSSTEPASEPQPTIDIKSFAVNSPLISGKIERKV